VVVVVRGTDGTSKPIFPIVPNDITQATNTTLGQLTDGNLGESGIPALAVANPLFIDTNADADYDPPGVNTTPTVDTDQDGCVNAREAGGSGTKGGLRNYMNFWDFYDVWSHPSGMPLAWERNRVINLPGDILGVAGRFGMGPPPPGKDLARAQALTPPVSNTGYHIAFDRGPQNGPYSWSRSGPDGSINIPDDILGVAAQFGHTCA